jgi:hypothetical protein
MSDNNTAMALFGGTGAVQIGNAKAMADALKSSAQEGSRSQLPDGGVYISFSGKLGTYSIGVDKNDADPEECWLVNIYDFQRGYICWKGGAPVARHMASIYGQQVSTPDASEHGPFKADRGEGWFPAKSITLRSIDQGIQGLFQTNTKSAVSEFAALEDKVADRLSAGEAAWPIVQLRKEKFTAQGQQNSKPVLHIYGWIGLKQVMEMSQMESVDAISDALDDMIEEAATGNHVPVEAKSTAKDAETMEYEVDDIEDAEVDGVEEAEVVPEVEETATRRRVASTEETKTPPRRRAAI